MTFCVSTIINIHDNTKHRRPLSWFQSRTQYPLRRSMSSCYKTHLNGYSGQPLYEHKQNLQFDTNCGTFGGPRQIHMSCQWQWMLKTVSNQTKKARLLYGRSDQADDHKESSNSVSWRNGRMQLAMQFGVWSERTVPFLNKWAHIFNTSSSRTSHLVVIHGALNHQVKSRINIEYTINEEICQTWQILKRRERKM